MKSGSYLVTDSKIGSTFVFHHEIFCLFSLFLAHVTLYSNKLGCFDSKISDTSEIQQFSNPMATVMWGLALRAERHWSHTLHSLTFPLSSNPPPIHLPAITHTIAHTHIFTYYCLFCWSYRFYVMYGFRECSSKTNAVCCKTL